MKKLLLLLLLASFISCESTKEQDLVSAIESGDKDKVQKLLDKGADPNADASGVMGDGTTATFEAACTGDMGMFQLLINAGGKVDKELEYGTKKIRLFNRLAFTIGNKMANCDFKNMEEVNNYIEIVDKAVELGASIAASSSGEGIGDFDVHIETEYDQKNAIYMVAANSSFGFSDIAENCVPYMKEMLQAFMKHGASLDDKDSWGYTALIYHIQHQNYRMIELLIGLGADVNLDGGDREASPLWYAKNVDLMNTDPYDIKYNEMFENDNEITRLLESSGAH